MPIEHAAGWMLRVAHNRITGLFRKKTPESFGDIAVDKFVAVVVGGALP